MVALMLLAGVSGMVPWFGPIANDLSDEFGFSLNQINWFSITLNFVYLPVSILVPIFLKKYGTRVTCYIGAVFMLLGAWVRYAGTPHSLSKRGAYALLMLGQIFGAIAQPIFQVLGPKYSEDWFNLKERTTVTMLVSVGQSTIRAIAQILSPAFSTTRISILYLGVISTAVLPFVFLIGEKPPTPPTYSASMHPLSFFSLARAMLGREPAASPAHMTVRERVDFAIVALEFGVLVGVITAFSFLTAQFFEPYGYSEDTAGLFGATLLLVGLVAGFITSPLYDRILTHHLALTCKILCPIVSATWLSLIWAVRSNNTIALYVLMGIIGGTSITLLPVALELAAELTRNADGSSAVLWLTANFFGALYILINGALRAGADANPPLNMHRALIFQGTVICVCTVSVVFLTGKQVRRERDELKAKESEGISASGSA
ncbi:major facilitator superfamily domain-containing protein [Cristinia sonorae]|uniref:Major facilitator superfamily domain-containing protein n=1 Tax=Cristinia sonorae TaxID=1940300 RepID=A0A8K0XQJ6_9AGAR|nr:major facilitator superfamily domain-containing protein [Cristinia sonorae]